MEDVITYFENYTMIDLFYAVTLVVIVVRAFERFGKWCLGYLRAYYEKKRGIEKKDDIITAHTKEIKSLVERMDRMVSSVDSHYTLLLKKFNDQEKRLEQLDEEGKRRDCALLRNHILEGMRHFGQNVDEDGIVHISITDHENMDAMFTEYFGCNGNGTVHLMYENEFKNWIIDK